MRPIGSDEPLLSDLALSRRLEAAEGLSNARHVEARAALSPAVGAAWARVGGAFVLFDGPESPCTQTFGLGVFEPATPALLDEIEGFFRARGAPVFHEVSPLAGPEILPLLGERGYRPIELTTVLFRSPPGAARWTVPANPRVQVRCVGPAERDLWMQVGARGWSEGADPSELLLDLMRVASRRGDDTALFLAELDGRPIGAAGLNISNGVALLAGASTLPEGRRQGAQLALLDARLRHAEERGCDLVMMGALPGSASQRNAERQGLRVAYTRIKWQLMVPRA